MSPFRRFNSILGQLEVQYGLHTISFQTGFNSILVQLEVSIAWLACEVAYGFNSILVQLEDGRVIGVIVDEKVSIPYWCN